MPDAYIVSRLTRRQFALILGSGLIATGTWRRRAQPSTGNPRFEVITRKSRALGTHVVLTVRHPIGTVAERAIAAAFAAIE